MVFSVISIAAAFLLLAAFGWRLVTQGGVWTWWLPFAIAVGMAAADLGSGLVHWGADTWGRDDFPVIGHRLLVPFRVHHVNPDDFLRRTFVDTNGDVAFLAIPLISLLFLLPLDNWWGSAAATAGFAFCGIGMMTNQIHQWAHMPAPPRLVRLLQDWSIILGRVEHAAHHQRPYDVHYCITTGWCNRAAEALGIFRRMETAITRVTSARPRQDDLRYEQRYGGSPHSGAVGHG
jgi:ubiquitin-conjugating enzyme E2 variant